MRMKKGVVYACLAGVIAMTCFMGSCKKTPDLSDSSESETIKEVPVYTEPSFADTDIVLAENGHTDYKILVPDEYDWRIQWAIQELTTYFKGTTGINLLTVSDSDAVVNNDSKYLSLGNTQLANQLNTQLSVDEYTEDGHYIKRVGNSVAIMAANDWGIYYGTLYFARYQLGVRYYATDTIVYSDYKQTPLYLKDFDWKNIPDFAQRSVGLADTMGEMADLRLGNESYFGRNWIGWAHTIFNLLPPATYKKDHPEWYAASGNQICYTNMEMRDELVEVIQKRIDDCSYKNINLEIGQMDGMGEKCVCSNCIAEENTYGGWSGVQMRFINDINDRLQAWLKTAYPEKTLKLCVFAYYDSADPPVIKNADGTYSPVHESVVAHENVGIMIAPLGADWSHSLWDETHNKRWAEIMKGWQCINADLYVWTYSTIFTNLLIFHDNYSYVKESYANWKDMGCIYIFDQGASAGNAMAFRELSAYVRSQLLWDTDADVEYYMDEFVDNYYGAGAPYIHQYLDMLRTRMRLIERDKNANGELFQILTYTTDQPELKGKEFWPREWLENAIALFDEAIEACESIEDETQRSLMIKHIKKERLSPIYLLMEIYRTELSSKDCLYYADTFVEDCDLNSITTLSEGGETVIKVTNDWYLEAEK